MTDGCFLSVVPSASVSCFNLVSLESRRRDRNLGLGVFLEMVSGNRNGGEEVKQEKTNIKTVTMAVGAAE